MLRLSHRVLVLRDRHVVADLENDSLTVDALLALIADGSSDDDEAMPPDVAAAPDAAGAADAATEPAPVAAGTAAGITPAASDPDHPTDATGGTR